MGLGRVKPGDSNEPFSMTVLALKMSRYANGISALHGVVSRRMWHPLYPNVTEENVPIGHITNGVHVQTWVAPQMEALVRSESGSELAQGPKAARDLARDRERGRRRALGDQAGPQSPADQLRERPPDQSVRRRNEPDSEVQKAMEALDLTRLDHRLCEAGCHL